jgi:hypothetical protein
MLIKKMKIKNIEIPSHPNGNGYYPKNKKITNAADNAGEKHLHVIHGDVN